MADEKKGMKTAYELALERLGLTESDVPTLTDEQKRRIAEIDRETMAKIAEQEILLKSRIVTALGSGKPEDATNLRDGLAAELRRIRERGEEKKEEVRLGESGASKTSGASKASSASKAGGGSKGRARGASKAGGKPTSTGHGGRCA